MRIVVVGAGIGGLTAAAVLGRGGHHVVLCERASRFGEVGAGIQLSPNATRILHGLGLAEALREVGTTPEATVVRRWEDDRVLRRNPLGPGIEERYGFPYYNLYRPDLIEVLAGAIGDVDVRLGVDVVSVVSEPERALVMLVDGATVAADVVVGADGVHSTVRSSAIGAFPSRFSGSVAYRALIPCDEVEDEPVVVTNRMGPGQHLVTYFVGRDRRWFNLVGLVPEATWDVESWTEPGAADDLRASYAGWSPGVRRLLDRVTDPVFRWALHDREPLPRWSRGRVTLLGDACHPMLPFMAQGACQAIEDAAVLARLLSERARDPTEALTEYEKVRRPRTSLVQERSWANATTFHLPDGPGQQRRDEAFERAPSPSVLDWLYGHDAAEPT